jgi:hypothetical protein
MGGAIAKASLYDRSRAATRKMETLVAVGDTIAVDSAEGYLDRILQVISEMVAETFDSPVCSIMIVDNDKKELSTKAARCSSPEYLQKHTIRIDNSLIDRVVNERKLVAVTDVSSEKLYRYPELARKSGLASLLSVPPHCRTARDRHICQSSRGPGCAGAGERAPDAGNSRDETTARGRKVIERAKGILQHRHGLSEEESYADLRSESRRLRKPMKELAEAIVLAEELYRRGKKKEESV